MWMKGKYSNVKYSLLQKMRNEERREFLCYKQKVEQFRVSIRKKALDQRMASIRASMNSSLEQVENPQTAIQKIKASLEGPNPQNTYAMMGQIRRASQNPYIFKYLKTQFQVFYMLLLQLDSRIKGEKATIMYTDLTTILINITSEQIINFSQQIHEDIFSPVIANIKNAKRETSTIWLIANILHRRNTFSSYFFKTLQKNKIRQYLKNRMDYSFNSETDATIYYYFVGGYIANLDFCLSFVEYKQSLALAEFLSNKNMEQLYWYMLDGIIQHSFYINKFKYEFFSTNLLAKCQQYCKSKKSRYVVKYLEAIARFLSGQSHQISSVGQENMKKVIVQQYTRVKQKSIIKNLQFCLDNRSPEVRKLLFEIGYMLITLYNSQISYIEEYFYLTLAESIKTVQKLDQSNISWLLKYFRTLLSALLVEGSIGKNKEYTKEFIDFLNQTELLDKIQALICQFSNSTDILNTSFDIIAFLLQYDISAISESLKKVQLISTLQSLQIETMQLNLKRDKLIDVLSAQQNL